MTSPPLPKQIGQYKIISILGYGGMGTVYLGEHLQTGQQAAVKILPESMAREPGFVARFNREVDAMRKLKSQHIVELYESGEDNGIYYYAMEYIPGETLTQRLDREKRLPWHDAIDIGVQVCRALKAAHNTGIIHRDLKPSNLLIHEDGTVKLTDFGIAQIFASAKLTVTGGVLGTAEFMSPEQAQGKRATVHSDIYSLGAVLYMMVTGRPPFTGKTTLDIAQKHRYAQFDSPKRIVPEIPYWLDEVICQCLSKKQEDRFPDAYVLGLRLQEIPKKVALKTGGTFQFDDASASSDTVTEHSEGVNREEVGGTIVRELFRAEIESQNRPTPWGKLLDNIWVLIGLLALLIGGGYAIAKWSRPSPEQMFAQGEELMNRPEGIAWETAAQDYFQPLLAIDEAEWKPRVAPYLAQVERYQLKKELLGPQLRRNTSPKSEPEAIIRQAMELRKTGQTGLALERLMALEQALEGDEDFRSMKDLAFSLRQEMLEQDQAERSRFAQQIHDRAQKFWNEGQKQQALTLWQSLKDLYHSDPAMTGLMQTVDQAMQASETSAPEADPATE